MEKKTEFRLKAFKLTKEIKNSLEKRLNNTYPMKYAGYE